MTAKRKAAPKYVWVSRDTEEFYGRYDIYRDKPLRNESGWFEARTEGSWIVGSMCPTGFEEMAGIKLRPGTCRRFLWRSPLVQIKRKAKVKP